ncbi:DNA alkylation repair protein [Bacillus lacus]|uniref:DNA alkylation repair protein n=1 Tax=Metabacillus lacus TaxID=1983721 RepID=A0A7X2IXP7_9BACI|nr:DNA alkylation repair protein [Metabacillus lacus]MRX71715.1 DNA alkylation repair protein [Metabacillus lacus]
MTAPYLCPNCKTNRSRFNIIEQLSHAVKKNPATGEITEEYETASAEIFHIQYKGPAYKVQCGACGLIEEELAFIKRAESTPNNRN